MADSTKVLRETVSKHLGAIAVCLAKHYHMPALALIYCGIDVFAALNRGASQRDATKHDFMDWCERFLLPGTTLSCTAADLYAARCAVLHTYTSKSALSRSGKAREIIYAWGNKTAQELQGIVDIRHRATHVVVHIETLAQAFESAVNAFFKGALSDPRRLPILEARARELFVAHERIL